MSVSSMESTSSKQDDEFDDFQLPDLSVCLCTCFVVMMNL